MDLETITIYMSSSSLLIDGYGIRKTDPNKHAYWVGK